MRRRMSYPVTAPNRRWCCLMALVLLGCNSASPPSEYDVQAEEESGGLHDNRVDGLRASRRGELSATLYLFD